MNVVAILRTDEAGQALNAACTDINGTEVIAHVGRLTDVQGDVDVLKDADILILDVDPRSDEEMNHLRKVMQTEFPGTPVVATATDASLQDVRQLMHLGVIDFVPQPITQSDLKTALEHAVRTRKSVAEPAAAEHGHIVSFLKAGGGVGASTLAVQSACLLASRKNAEKSQVCLIDLDLQFGTDALYLDLDNRVGVADLLETPDRIDRELLNSVMGHHPSGVELLAAPRDVVALESLHATDLERCLKLVRNEYRTIFLDLPSAWTPWSYAAVRNSDLLILVIQLTVAGVRQARRQIEALQVHGLGDVPLKVALNRFEKGWGKSVDVKDAEKALGRKFDYFIANDYSTVNDALNQGVALSAIKKNSKVEQSLQKMIDDTIKTITGEEARPEPRLLSGLRR
jgi:pilus assembly protein CpaE